MFRNVTTLDIARKTAQPSAWCG